MFILPGNIFSSWIKGRELAVDRNWQDIQNRNVSRNQQLENLVSLMDAEHLMERRPGGLTMARAESDDLVRNAEKIVANRRAATGLAGLSERREATERYPEYEHLFPDYVLPNYGGAVHPGYAGGQGLPQWPMPQGGQWGDPAGMFMDWGAWRNGGGGYGDWGSGPRYEGPSARGYGDSWRMDPTFWNDGDPMSDPYDNGWGY
jgi:hypothetical protein